jgi:hypothetical protein
MFEVRGFVGDVPYALRADADHSGPDGVVIASAPRIALDRLRAREGESVLATVTGPSVLVSVNDVGGVLAGLCAFTQVTDVLGDAPQLAPSEEGVIY